MTKIAKSARIFARTLGVLAAVAVAAGAPLVAGAAEAHGGGGGGGGAHFSGGGGGGAHFGGGHSAPAGHAGFSGGRAGYAGGARPAYAGGGARFSGGAHYGGVVSNHAHYAVAANHSYGGYAAGGGRFVSHAGGYGGRPGFGHPGFAGGSGRFWGGGYWGGRFWPGVRYGAGFAWFLPVLPFGYATYYWGSTPYYYYDNAYYNWDPSQNGYVATDPPPVMQGGSDEPPQSDVPQSSDAPSADYVPAPQSNYSQPPQSSNSAAPAGPRGNWSSAADIYVYPRNGQNDQQTSTDRFECHKWSVAQTGFDPTRAMNLQGTSVDYRRAMGACLDARGYSVK
jgi:hypothetical protein